MKADDRSWLFVTLVATFVTSLVVGDLIGCKLTAVTLAGSEYPFSVGQIAFPVTFILTDILNEFYGRQVARRVTYLAFAMVALTFAFIYLSDLLPWWSRTGAADWDGVREQDFDVVFTQATRIQISSMFAFLAANLVDISVFFLIKRLTGNRLLWLRATGSTAVSQLIDTVLINWWVWGSKMTPDEYVKIVVTSWLIKLAAAICVTPLIYGLHVVVERRFQLEPVRPDAA